MKAPVLWFIITPKGGLFKQKRSRGLGFTTRKKAIENLTWDMAYGGVTEADVWADFKRDGYTVEKRRVI